MLEADHPAAAPKPMAAINPFPTPKLSVETRRVSVGEEVVHAASAEPLEDVSSSEDVEGPSKSSKKSYPLSVSIKDSAKFITEPNGAVMVAVHTQPLP